MNRLFKRMTALRHLWQSEQGSAMPFVALGILMLMGATGTAIDMGRVQIVQTRMQNALDATGLAVGSIVNTTADLNAETTKYFYANFPANYLGTTITTLSATPNADNSIITMAVAGTVDTTFMRLFGINYVDVGAQAEITRASQGMELVLVIDTTGSMNSTAGGGISKIAAARNAATDLVNTLYGSASTLDNLWIGLVPFAQAVNIGPSHTDWVSADSFNWGPTSWMGCVDAREAGGEDVTDTPPNISVSATLFPRYYWPCDGNNQWYGTNSGKTNCTPSGSGFGYKTPLSTSRGPNKYCSQEVTPLTSSKTEILDDISTLTAYGNTHVVLGAAWGWRMLSPSWRGLWGGSMDADGLPLDYDTPLMNKVMILMTDGDNTISNYTRGAYWYLSNGKLGTTNQSTAEAQLDSRTLQVCTSMKAQNITIYTIALGTDLTTNSKNMLRNCASNTDFYFESPTTADLQATFQAIGDSLANLRISQ